MGECDGPRDINYKKKIETRLERNSLEMFTFIRVEEIRVSQYIINFCSHCKWKACFS